MKRISLYVALFVILTSSAFADNKHGGFSNDERWKNLIWTPTSSGYSRFIFNIPNSDYTKAIKYNDASALFYNSNIQELGLRYTQDLSVHGYITPQSRGIRLGFPVAGDNKIYSEVARVQETEMSQNKMVVGLGVEFIDDGPQITQLQMVRAGNNKTSVKLHSTLLSLHEDMQHSFWAQSDIDNNVIEAGYEVRLYDVFYNTDLFFRSSLRNNYLAVQPQIEFQKDSLSYRVGFKGDTTFSGLDIFLQISVDFELSLSDVNRLTFSSHSDDRFLPIHLPNLKTMTRHYLHRHWAEKFDFKKTQ